jgi:hypothetical protein
MTKSLALAHTPGGAVAGRPVMAGLCEIGSHYASSALGCSPSSEAAEPNACCFGEVLVRGLLHNILPLRAILHGRGYYRPNLILATLKSIFSVTYITMATIFCGTKTPLTD